MSTTTTQPLKLEVNRLIKAPRERVFAAWTTPSDIMKWFGCGGSTPLSAETDPRAGGAYKIRMKSEEHGIMEVTGVYTEIKPVSRLAFTWGWVESDSAPRIETMVIIDLIDRNGSTEVKITHEGFSDSESCARHEYGWNGCLDHFEKLV